MSKDKIIKASDLLKTAETYIKGALLLADDNSKAQYFPLMRAVTEIVSNTTGDEIGDEEQKEQTAPAKEQHGHWMHFKEGSIPYIRCSVCGEQHARGVVSVKMHEDDDICPNCGAVMNEVDEI